jgi:hypothetical protein
MLDKVAFDWDPKETAWMRYYEDLKAFRRKNGRCDPVFRTPLGRWVINQRGKANTMPPHRKKLLDQIGFGWNTKRHDTWMRCYKDLTAYHLKHGRSPVPRESALGVWVAAQRQLHRNRRMLPERKKLLDKIGFVWRVYAPKSCSRV